MDKRAKIYVAGHRGLVGSAIVRCLKGKGFTGLVVRTHKESDLTNQAAVDDFFQKERPEYIFLAAAKVGGILANSTYPAEFLYENLAIQNNVIWAAHKTKVKKLLFLGSSCIYPKYAPQPIKEEYLLSGSLEPTNEPYALAKIAGLKMCYYLYKQFGDNFISVMPTNLYGPNDNFDPKTSHVLPALIGKFYEAKVAKLPEVVLWGTGTPRREFLHVDDLADACVFLMRNYNEPETINIGTGRDISIKELAELVKGIVGYQGNLRWDRTKPDGTPRKLLDVSKLHQLGWRHKIGLSEGIKSVYHWFLQTKGAGKA